MRSRMIEWLGGSGASFLVPDYAFVLALAIVFGVYLTLRRAEASALDPQKVFRVCLATIAVALVSARLYVVMLTNYGSSL